jgi:hypothetical protein
VDSVRGIMNLEDGVEEKREQRKRREMETKLF